jgi:hypothetical protein
MMESRTSSVFISLSFIIIASVFSGCGTNKVDLVDAGVITMNKTATGKVYVAWSSAREVEDGFEVTGVLRRSDSVGLPIMAYVDVTVVSPDGRIIESARSDAVYVPRRRIGRGQSMQRFKVKLPEIPPQGSSVRLVSHSGSHNDAA